MAKAEHYFVVWCEGGGTPTVKHPDWLSAKREAQRLAREHRGHRFTVMVAVAGFQAIDLQETEYLGFDRALDDGIPF